MTDDNAQVKSEAVQAEQQGEVAAEERQMTPEEIAQALAERAAEIRKRTQEANEAMKTGKGRLQLETPIRAGGKEISELIYDFTALTGMEYTDAMDSDPNSANLNFQRITNRQGLYLFAKAAAKQTELVDVQDIVSQIGVTDAVEGVQLATLFFNASTRAGRLRISKR